MEENKKLDSTLEAFVEEYRSSIKAKGGIETRDDNPTVITWKYNGTDYTTGDTVVISTDASAKTIQAGQTFVPSTETMSWGNDLSTNDIVSSCIFSSTKGSWQNVSIGIKANTSGEARTTTFHEKKAGGSNIFTITINQAASEDATYTIRFLDYDNSVLKTQSLRAGETPTPPANPSRSGYSFSGWSPTISTVSGDQDYIAQYNQLGQIGISSISDDNWYWYSAGATPETAPIFYFIGRGPGYISNRYNTFSVKSPVSGNFAYYSGSDLFDLYYGDPQRAGNTIALTANVATTFGIESGSNTTFETTVYRLPDGGYVKFAQRIAQGNDPTHVRGYTFQSDEFTLHSYVELPHQPSGSIVDQDPDDLFQGTLPTKQGYTFAGWVPTVAYRNSWQTFIATWTVNPQATWTIRFLDYDGTIISSDTYTNGDQITVPSNPTRTGYTFLGWSPEVNTTATANQDYTAQYIKDPIGVVYNGTTTYFNQAEGVSHAYITWKGFSADSNGLNLTLTRTPVSGERFDTKNWSGNTSNTIGITRSYITNGYSVINGTAVLHYSVNNGSDGEWVHTLRFTDSDGVYTYLHIHITRQQLDSYTIRFLDWDDTVLKSESMLEGQTPTPPTNPTRIGYNFTGWSPSITTVSQDQDYTAQYVESSTPVYTVRFLDYDGTVLKSTLYEQGDTIVPPSNPTREGYNFTGWSPNLPSGATASQDQDYTAQYSAVSQDPTTVTLKINGVDFEPGSTITLSGYSGDNASYEIGQSFIPNNVYGSWTNTIPYGSFVRSFTLSSTKGSWQSIILGLNENTTGEDRSQSFTIKVGTGNNYLFNIVIGQNAGEGGGSSGEGPFTITFVDYDGTVISTNTYAKNATITIPATPSRSGYTFTGWSPNVSSTAVRDQVYTATYVEGEGQDIGTGEFLVRFLDWDGSVYSAHRYDRGDTIVKPSDPTRTGYTFTKWNPTVPTTCTKSADYTAQYKINSYTIVFKSWDDTVLSSKKYEYGSTIEVPTPPKRIHYKFKGWNPTVSTVAVEDITYVAVYEYTEYTMTFIDWDGTVLQSFTYTEGSIAAIPVPPDRPGWQFVEWHLQYTDENGNMTYIAVYTEIGIKIKFYSWNGDLLQETVYSYGDTISVPTPPERTGYVFDTWFPEIDPIAHEDAEYTAFYKRIYTTKWDFYVDGIVVQTYSKTDEEIYLGRDYTLYDISPSDPVKSGFLFKGWAGEGFEEDDETKTKTWKFEGMFTQNSTAYNFYDNDRKTLLFTLMYAGIGGSDYSSYVNPGTPTKTGYKFLNWTLFASGSGFYSYYATWTPWAFKMNTRPNMPRNKYKYYLV